MPVIFQKRIYREDLQNNPDVLYVFGDNLARIGMGGQAAEMRGEPNAVGMPTKRSPSEYLCDDDFDEVWKAIAKDASRLLGFLGRGGTVVWPTDGIGTGLAQLEQHAPEIHAAYLRLLDLFVEEGSGTSCMTISFQNGDVEAAGSREGCTS